ncbi:sterile alpha motif domain-containing protein 9-like [Lates japonicus]
MMSKDKIFRDLRVQENLLKFHGVVKKYSLFTTIGGMEIKVKAHKRDSLWFPHEVSFYLGFTIRGLLAFGIKRKPSENRPPKCCASCGSDMAESKTDVKQDSCTWTAATPKRTTLNHAPTYSFQSEAGQFQCSMSGLRWVCKKKVSFMYQFRSWEEHKQKLDMVHCSPGGPLLDIRVTDGEFNEVHLPHWICLDGFSTVSDKFAVLHNDTFGNFLEQVSDVTSRYVKLFHLNFSTHGVLRRAGFPVKAHCNVLIYQTNKTPPMLHVHLIPYDPALQQEVEQMERTSGSRIIQKPNPQKSLKILGSFILRTDAKTADISPAEMKLEHECGIPCFFTVLIKKTNRDFTLTLGDKEEDLWSCTISRG